MQRLTRTTAGELKIGDRFFKANDKHKSVYEVKGFTLHANKQKFKVQVAKDGQNPKYPDELLNTFEVIYLRSITLNN